MSLAEPLVFGEIPPAKAPLPRWIFQEHQGLIAALALCWSLGIWVGMGRSVIIWPWMLLWAGAGLVSRRAWVLKAWILGWAFWLGLGLTQLPQPQPPFGPVTVSGWLMEPRWFQVEQVGQQQNPFLVKLSRPLPLAVGVPVSLQGELRPAFPPSLPGAFDEAAYLAGRHAVGVLKPDLATVRPMAGPSPPAAAIQTHVSQLRQRLADGLVSTFPDKPFHQALMGGLLLGDDALPLPKAYEKALLNTGLLHVVSASGANLAMVAGLLLLMCKRMPNPWVRRACLVLGVTGYAWLTGFPPSIQRAYAMLSVATVLKWTGLPAKPITLLLLAVALLLGVAPWLAQSLGFQLSVLATAGILWLSPLMGRRVWQQWFAIPLAAELFALPWSSSLFHQWSWVALPMNVLLDGLLLPLTWIAALGGVVTGVGLPGQWIWLTALPLLELFNGLLSWVNQWPGILGRCPQWPAASLASWYALLMAWPLLRLGKRGLTMVFLACGAGVVLPWVLVGVLLNVPHTRSLALPSGEKVLLTRREAGWCLRKPSDWTHWQQRALPQWLTTQGIRRITPCD